MADTPEVAECILGSTERENSTDRHMNEAKRIAEGFFLRIFKWGGNQFFSDTEICLIRNYSHPCNKYHLFDAHCSVLSNMFKPTSHKTDKTEALTSIIVNLLLLFFIIGIILSLSTTWQYTMACTTLQAHEASHPHCPKRDSLNSWSPPVSSH